MKLTNIYEVVIGTYYSKGSNTKFEVLGLARHGQCCLRSMVIYRNLEDTKDTPKDQIWVISESLFLQNFGILED